jgi:predicted metal-dependent phosphoesterase TrpH
MIKVDLHVHTRYSVDGTLSPETIVEASLRSGVGALAITDHNTIAGALALRQVAPFPVIIGQEISTSHGEMMGLFLKEQVPRDLSAFETMELVKEQGGLVGVPHPFDRFRSESLDKAVLEEIGGELDFVEGLNGRVTLPEDNRRAREFAHGNGVPCTAGSDAHIAYELGCAYLEMDHFDGGREQFVLELPRARIAGGCSPIWVHFFSLYAKARNRLAGD